VITSQTIPANQGYPVDNCQLLTGPVIVTRYLGPTNHRGSRVKATHQRDSEVTWQATLDWDHSLDSTANHQLAAKQLLSKWVTSDNLVIVGRGHDHNCYYWLAVGAWQLVQAREQIQENLLALIDSDNQQLNNAICQIIVTNFSKFFL
jgi:hypothetical protein